jgi:hypothetical protein
VGDGVSVGNGVSVSVRIDVGVRNGIVAVWAAFVLVGVIGVYVGIWVAGGSVRVSVGVGDEVCVPVRIGVGDRDGAGKAVAVYAAVVLFGVVGVRVGVCVAVGSVRVSVGVGDEVCVPVRIGVGVRDGAGKMVTACAAVVLVGAVGVCVASGDVRVRVAVGE